MQYVIVLTVYRFPSPPAFRKFWLAHCRLRSCAWFISYRDL